MIQPAKLDLGADRWVAFVRSLPFINADFTGAAFAMHVRSVPDAPGDPLIALAGVSTSTAQGVRLMYAGSDTIANHVAAGRLPAIPDGFDPSTVVALSLIGIRINETTMEALTFPAERGDDLELAWDIHITPAGAIKDKYAGGRFIVRAGATQ